MKTTKSIHFYINKSRLKLKYLFIYKLNQLLVKFKKKFKF